MKQVFQNYKTGEVRLDEVPTPACKPGGIVVRTLFSAISPGTELMKISESKLSLLGKARARPDQVKKVLATLAQQGPLATYEKVMQRLDSLTPLGYSLCGEVVEVGEGVAEFSVGDRVSCAGNAHALHAELNWVPVNLAVRVPAGVEASHAAFGAIGSIALQGLRQAIVQPGELVCVVGLGLIGQILVRMLKATGARPIGVDLSTERCELALAAGAEIAHNPTAADISTFIDAVGALSDGQGCDHIIISAGGASNSAIELAPLVGRDRARVTVIGKTGLSLSWNAFYEKEMEIAFSRSYGPGRYDATYEEGGIDYPIGYVRWTERRNIQEVIRMLSTGQLDLAPLISSSHPFDRATDVFERLNKGELKGVGFVFSYPNDTPRVRVVESVSAPAVRREQTSSVRVAAIGCGNYATTNLFPHFKDHTDVSLVEVATTTPTSAANAGRRFGFKRISTDARHVLDASDVDLIVIATRHSSHADLVCAALETGKAVFVEKPLAITLAECDRIAQTAARSGNNRLMVGFNRRFAPLFGELRRLYGASPARQTVLYRVNAGKLDDKSWYLDRVKEGSRFVGEGGHFIDATSWWLGRDPTEVSAQRSTDDPDEIVVTLRYADTIATISYLTNGDPRFPKERFEAFGGGRTALLDNFAACEAWSNGKRRRATSMLRQDKGQKAQVEAIVAAVRNGGPMPISFASLMKTTRATIMAELAASEPGRTHSLDA